MIKMIEKLKIFLIFVICFSLELSLMRPNIRGGYIRAVHGPGGTPCFRPVIPLGKPQKSSSTSSQATMATKFFDLIGPAFTSPPLSGLTPLKFFLCPPV